MDLKNLLSHSTLFTLSGLLPLFLLYIFSSIARRRRRGQTKALTRKAPPEAGGAWPLIGHLHLLGGSQPLHVRLGDMADKYGPIFTIRIGAHNTLVVSNSDLAKECFTVNNKAFSSRPKTIAFDVLGYNFSILTFSPYGTYWRHVRKISILELLSTHRIEMAKHVMVSEVKTAINDSYNYWLKMKKSGLEKKCTEMKKWFGEISLNVMFRMVVGKRFASDGDNEENERIREALRVFFDLSGSFVVSDALPYLRWLDLDGGEKAMKKTAKELDHFAQVWLEEHKRKRNCGSDRDFMDALLSIVDQELDGRDIDTTVKATCLTLILAGTDTSTGTLTWALSLLLNNPEALNKAKHELDTQIGKQRMVEQSDLKNLVYLQAIIKETLRLYPPAPLSAPHESIEDCVVGGYYVPAGTRLLPNLSKIQRDPLIYHDPLEFRPERFLTVHKSVDLRGQNFELIPFGAGRRMCPGLSFGLEIVQLTLASLLHGFEVVTVDGMAVDMGEQVGLTSIKASPLHVILTHVCMLRFMVNSTLLMLYVLSK